MADGTGTANEELLREAEEVAANVHALRRLLLRSFEPDIAKGGVTVPQMNALEELSKEEGLSVKELSARMGLSHSTVSGIVARLQRKGFVGRNRTRKTDATAASSSPRKSRTTCGRRCRPAGWVRSSRR